MLIQWPPSPYHREILSSAQRCQLGEKNCFRCSLKLETKSSTSNHRYASCDIPSGRTGGCLLHTIKRKIISNRSRLIPVLSPKLAAGTYFEDGLDDHKSRLSPNLNQVISKRMPSHLSTSPFVNRGLPTATSFKDVSSTINFN